MMAIIRVNDNPVASSASISVGLGATGTDTVIEIVVTAPNGTTTNSYTVTVSRDPSSDATLSGLMVSAGELSEPFDSTTRVYTVSVENDVERLTVTPTANDANATITVDDEEVESESASSAIELTEGDVTTITIEVTAQDGNTEETYTIAVNRAASADASLSDLVVSAGELDPTFNSTTSSYTVSVGNDTGSLTVTPTAANANATITVNNVPVESGNASSTIELAEGEVTTIVIVVTAQDDTENTYTIAVSRAASADATLSALTVSAGTLMPAFNSTNYTVSVGNDIESLTVTLTATNENATITVSAAEVETQTVESGNPSNAIPLAAGEVTTITVVVTAQDGTQNTYTIIVRRESAPVVRVRVKALLEGPLRGDSIMGNFINALVPTQDVYCDGSYQLVDTSGISPEVDNQHLCPRVSLDSVPIAVVDWVLVELRAVENGGNVGSTRARDAYEDTVIARKPAFILTNGRIVDAELYNALEDGQQDPASCTGLTESDSCPDVLFDQGDVATEVREKDLYIVVRHRNHIDIISNMPVAEEEGIYAYDFSTATEQALGGIAALKGREGNFAMYGGDADGDGNISLGDWNTQILPNNGRFDYLASDTDMNGNTDLSDLFLLTIPNDGVSMQVPMQTAVTEAQTSFIQSRYIGNPASAICSDCDPVLDGVTHIRFDPESVTLSNDGGDFITLKVQIRRIGGTGGNNVGYISEAGFRLKYDNTIFGDNLNDPAITEDGSAGSQCSYQRSSFFANTLQSSFFVNTPQYNLAFRDTNTSELNMNAANPLRVQATFNIPRDFLVSNVSVAGEAWEDYLTLTCEIPSSQTDNEAGVGFAGSQPRGIFYLRLPDGNIDRAIPSTAFLLADNDLRGFRLDGKTWAEDYARYGDGAGVRLSFSKGIQTELTASNFAVVDADGNPVIVDGVAVIVSSVNHTPGESYANVELSDTVSSGILRLVSTTTVVMDADGDELADGNFLASLEYDADAPRVTSVSSRLTDFNTEEQAIANADSGNNYSVREITFSSLISVATIDTDDICVTATREGSCVTGETPSVANIDGGSATTTTMIRVLINEGDGTVASSGGSLEFRRNAMLGADYRVVEDYQQPLRGIIDIADTQPPVIAITEAEATVDDDNALLYTITFTVAADEPVPTLSDINSYRLLRLPTDGDAEEITPVNQSISGGDRQAMLTYTYTFADDDALRNTTGFVLARSSSTALVDTSGLSPVVGLNGELDPSNDDAVATNPADASLSALTVSEGTLSLTFSSTIQSYTVSVENDIERLTVMPTATNANATITVNDEAVDSGSTSRAIPLAEGDDTIITIEVTAQDRMTTNSYVVTVNRAPSTDATLSNLMLTDRFSQTPVRVEPVSFDAEVVEYSARVLDTVSTVTVTVSATNANAEIRVGDADVQSGTSFDVALNDPGSATPIEIEVTAQDRMTTRTYTITVNRAALPAPNDAELFDLALMANGEAIALDFDSMMLTYTVSVAHTVDTIAVTPTANNSNATIEVNGNDVGSGNSEEVMLEGVGEDTEIFVIVTAADGVTMVNYTVTVRRALSNDASLRALVLTDTNGNVIELSPTFAPMMTSYSASVADTVGEVQVTPVATEGMMAMIMVGNADVVSSDSISVNLGATDTDTAIEIVVTAPNRTTTNSYIVTVSRAASSDASLSNLEVSPGTLSEAFDSTTLNYTVSVVNDIEELTVRPTANNINAAITVEAAGVETQTVESGTTSTAIELAEGEVTTITVVVTAQDETTNTYTIAVSRAPSADASLSDLVVSAGALSPPFGSTTLNYTVSVENDTERLTVIPMATNVNATITVNDATVESGSASDSIALLEGGTTTITVVVTAQDSSMNTYTVLVTRAASPDASLSDLALTDTNDIMIALVPDFASTITSYAASVTHTVAEVRVTPVASEGMLAIIRIGNDTVASGDSADISLGVPGTDTDIEIVVTAPNGTTTNSYMVRVSRALSDDATLSALTLTDMASEDNLVQVEPFDEDTLEYTAEVHHTVSTLTVSVLATDNENAEITVNSTEVASGGMLDIALPEAGNSTNIEIVVTAQNRITTRTYAVTVNRASSPAEGDATLFNIALMANGKSIALDFDSEVPRYTVNVPHTVASLAVTPIANNDDVDSISINGNEAENRMPKDVVLGDVGEDTEIVVIVTAADGTTTASYTVTVNRALSNDATLRALMLTDNERNMIILTPAFASEMTNYTASVSETVAEVQVTPVASEGMMATIRVGNETVASSASATVLLGATGTTTDIEIVVTAPNGTTTNSYTVTVSRDPSSDATLSGLMVSAGELSEPFDSTTRVYTVSVENNVERLTVTPTANNANATITVDSIEVASESASSAIELAEGEVTTITIEVTAQAGNTMEYTIAVSRAASADASLRDLVVSEGELDPTFSSTTLSYTVSVENDIASLTVTPTAANANATITVDDEKVESESASSAIELAEGEVTTITIEVTAQDETTMESYTIAVNRAASSDASLSGLEVSASELEPAFSSTTLTYTVMVDNATTMTTVTPAARHPRATITVDGEAVESGNASSAIQLAEGAVTTITIIVTAQDGTKEETYTIAVNRAGRPAGIRVRVKVFLEGPLR